MSGAKTRFDIVHLPPTRDEWLVQSLLGVMTDKTGAAFGLNLNYLAAPSEFDAELAAQIAAEDSTCGVKRVFQSRTEAELVVEKLGSHYGELKDVMKRLVGQRNNLTTSGAGLSDVTEQESMQMCTGELSLQLTTVT